jgi:hypothetical protein
VGDEVIIRGCSTIPALNTPTAMTILGVDYFDVPNTGGIILPTPHSLTFVKLSGVPAGLLGKDSLLETGIVTRLTAAQTQPPLFFTDPGQFDPEDGAGPFVITKSVQSVEHPGLMIPDVIIGSVMRVQRFTLTSAQILNLHTTPVQVLPEPIFVASGVQGRPGVRLAYNLHSVSFRVNPGTHEYSRGASKLNLFLGPEENEINYLSDPDDITAMLEETEPKVWLGAQLNDLEAQPAGIIENQPVIVASDSAITSGDGTLTVIIEYTVVQT